LLSESVPDGRALLREVLSGPLVFRPEGKGYHFRDPVITGALIAGAVGAQKGTSPGGTPISYGSFRVRLRLAA
jgi:hypothetical protein